MKVYVIKNKENKYMTETRDFIKSLWQAELFYEYDSAYAFAPVDCEVVDCYLMEGFEFLELEKEAESQHQSFINCFKTNLGLITHCYILQKALELACEELNCELSDPNNKLYTKDKKDIAEYFINKIQEDLRCQK